MNRILTNNRMVNQARNLVAELEAADRDDIIYKCVIKLKRNGVETRLKEKLVLNASINRTDEIFAKSKARFLSSQKVR